MRRQRPGAVGESGTVGASGGWWWCGWCASGAVGESGAYFGGGGGSLILTHSLNVTESRRIQTARFRALDRFDVSISN